MGGSPSHQAQQQHDWASNALTSCQSLSSPSSELDIPSPAASASLALPVNYSCPHPLSAPPSELVMPSPAASAYLALPLT